MSTNSKKFPNKQQISDVILDDPDLLYHIKISVFDCYIYHAVLNNDFNLERKNAILLEIGRAETLLHNLQITICDNIDPDVNNLRDMEIAGIRAEIREAFDDLPELQFFENLDISCPRSTFFEVLASNVKKHNIRASIMGL